MDARLPAVRTRFWTICGVARTSTGVRSHIRFDTELSDATYDEPSATWRLRTSGRPHADEPRADLRDGSAQPAQHPESSGHRPVPRPCVPLIAVGCVSRPARQERRRHRHRRERHPDRARDRIRRAQADAVPAHAAVGDPAKRRRDRTAAALAAPAACRATRGACARWSTGCSRSARSVSRSSRRCCRAAKRSRCDISSARSPIPSCGAKLTPNYRMGCKRVLISDDYYPALRRPNVEVVTAPIAEVRERSVVTADGAEHPADVHHLRHGIPRDRRHRAGARVRPRRARARATPGATAWRRISAPASPAFPTCSR